MEAKTNFRGDALMGLRPYRSKAFRKYHREWMRDWRAKPENREHEQLMYQLRQGVREKIVSEESYWKEVWHPGKVRVLKP